MTNTSNKAARNSIYLYIKMFVSISLSVIGLRIVLVSIGVENFGIFNLVAGLTGMLSFLSSAMSVSAQRYFSNYIGKGDSKMLIASFQNSLILNFIIAVFLITVLQLAGNIYINEYINVDAEKIHSVKLVFQLVVFTVLVNLAGLSFDASMIAREDIHIMAAIEIVEIILRFILILTISLYPHDKLVYYAIIMAISFSFSRIVKIIYSFFKYEEVTFKNFKIEKTQLKEMASFFGWNTFGAASGVFRNQGIALVINLFFGPILNASYGISMRLNSYIKNTSINIIKPLFPVIYQQFGAGKVQKMLKTSLLSCKIGFYVTFLFSSPIIFQIDLVLNTWLKEVPEYSNILSILFIFLVCVNILTNGIQTALKAIGKIKIYQSVVGSLIISVPVISYFLLQNNFAIYYVLVIAIVIEIISNFIRLLLLKKFSDFNLKSYFKNVLYPSFVVFTLISIFSFFVVNLIDLNNLIFLLLKSTIILIGGLIIIYLAGLSEIERNELKRLSKNLVKKNKS